MVLNCPTDIYDEATPLRIVEVVSALHAVTGRRIRLEKRWALNDAANFARRALEVAIGSARFASVEREKGYVIEDWRQVEMDAARAAASLRALLKNIARRADLKFPIRDTSPIAGQLAQFHLHQKSSESVRELNDLGRTDAKILADADDLLHRFESYAGRMRQQISSNRTNHGEPEKREFVFVLAEAWVLLTGRRPGSSPERNPFLNFVEESWRDAGGEGEQDFSRALRSALARLPPNLGTAVDSFRPQSPF